MPHATATIKITIRLTLILATLGLMAACQPQISLVTVTEEVPVTRQILLEVTAEVTREIQVTREVERLATVEVTRLAEPEASGLFSDIPPVGTAERPFRFIFLPTEDGRVVQIRGGLLLDALTEATGYIFEMVIPANEREAITELCTHSQESLALLTAASYATAAAECNAQLRYTALRFDVPYSLGMLVVRTDAPFTSIRSLPAGAKIGIPNTADLTTYQLFSDDWTTQAPEIIPLGNSSATLLALLNNEVEAATAVYNPPILPRNERLWLYATDDPELWRDLGVAPRRHPIGYIDVNGTPEQGGYRIRDARAALFDTHPEIFTETRILALSDPLPNEAIALGAELPLLPSETISQALADFLNSDACAQSLCASDFYQWTGITPATADAYTIFQTLSGNLPEGNPPE